MSTKEFYVYLHRKATNGEVFYVGKGTGERAISAWGRNPYYKNTVEKYGLEVEIYMSGLQEWYAFELEQELITLYGRRDLGYGKLTNMTDGGEGCIRKGVVPEYLKEEWRRSTFSLARALKYGVAESKSPKVQRKNCEILMDESVSFKSVSDILKFLSIRIDTHSCLAIRRCCDVELLSYKGHTFRYADHRLEDYNKAWLELQNRLQEQYKNRAYSDNSKRLICLDLGVCFKSSMDAKKYLISIGYDKCDDATIRKAATGFRGKAYGFKWMMINGE